MDKDAALKIGFSERIQFNLRIPKLIKAKLGKAGDKSRRSQNEEMLYRLDNFTDHEQMISEMRQQMQEIKANQRAMLDEIRTISKKLSEKDQ